MYLLAYNGSGFDRYVVLKKLPQWRTVVGFIKNRSGIVSLKFFNGYVDEKKKILNMFISDADYYILKIQ